MTTPDRGDVVLVPFPFTDLAGVKRRPALVLTGADYNVVMGDVIIAQITSRVSAPLRPGDYLVADWQGAGLLAPSLLRTKLTTIHSDLIVRKLGTMPASDMHQIRRTIAGVLGL
jgi:mRNA interferase MazF